MIRQAREFNADIASCEFVLNERKDLSSIESGCVDFVYSVLVLQHIERPYAEYYLREFVRVLSPRGLAVFRALDQPGGSVTGLLSRLIPSPLLELYRRLRYGRQRIKMHTVPMERVHTVVREAGGRVIQQEEQCDASKRWKSTRYFVRRTEVA